jgi:hypothetical protein
MGYTLVNYSQAITLIFIYAAVSGALLTIPVFIWNWLIKYRFSLGKSKDLLFRRLIFFGGLILSLLLALFLLIPSFILTQVNAIVQNKNIIEQHIGGYFLFYALSMVMSYCMVYFSVALLFKLFLKRHKHFLVFYSDNKIFGVF